MSTKNHISQLQQYLPLQQSDTILTPTQRLARSIKLQLNTEQQNSTIASWRLPNIQVANQWATSLYELSIDLPGILLSTHQQHLIWEEIVFNCKNTQQSIQIPPKSLISLISDAWNQLTSHCIPSNEILKHEQLNSHQFFLWCQQYEAYCQKKGWINPSQLPLLLKKHYPTIHPLLPKRIFITQQQSILPNLQQLLSHLANLGCELIEIPLPKQKTASSYQKPCIDEDDEITEMAQYCHKILTTTKEARIACIVPNLNTVSHKIEQQLKQALDEKTWRQQTDNYQPPFNISLGRSFSKFPLIYHPLSIAEIFTTIGADIPISMVQRFLDSPFISSTVQDHHLMLKYLQLERHTIDWHQLRKTSALFYQKNETVDQHQTKIERLYQFKKNIPSNKQSHQGWCQYFLNFLNLLGWPGEQTLNSQLYQLQQQFLQQLSQLETLDLVNPKISWQTFLSHLKHLITQTQFKAEQPRSSIDIMGIFEAEGLDYDHIWVMGMTQQQWPPQAHLNPLIPYSVQKKYHIWGANVAEQLAYSNRFCQQLQAQCQQLIVSYPRQIEQIIQQPFHFLHSLPTLQTTTRSIDIQPLSIELFKDEAAPTLQHTEVNHGINLLQAQLNCPLSALATYRLKATALPVANTGISAAQKGNLLHNILAQIWREHPTATLLQQQIDSHSDWLNNIIRQQLTSLHIDPIEKELELIRITQIIRAMLLIELERGDFTVIETEQKHKITIKPLSFNVRLDRIDQLPNEQLAIIDYKTGNISNSIAQKKPEELKQLQLPVYSQLTHSLDALLLFQLSLRHNTQYHGYIETLGYLSNYLKMKEINIKETREVWRIKLESLAQDFYAGIAHITPSSTTCQYCQLAGFCRKDDRNLKND